MSGKTILIEDVPSTSASASAPYLQGTYQVFLSFRGIDTRYGFTDYLYHDLIGAGVSTFRDDDELRVGEEIGPELLKAIQDSKVLIPVFSKNYAESKWCLSELSKMVECRANGDQKILPIFYDVEPYEVQHYERGSYNEAFVRYENDPSLDQKIVEEWKKALAIVGELKGFELKKATNGYEGALVKMVVKKVFSKLKKNNVHLPDTLVGMDNHIEKLKKLLNRDPNGVRAIGILGMSGLGKTTIAKAIYNELNKFFDSHCFLEDVRGKSQHDSGLIRLQKQLVSKILNRKIPEFEDVDEGAAIIKDAIRGKKVLIVLDNVDNKRQIDKLTVNHNWYFYGAKSTIIVTTTNEEVLLASEVTCHYKPKPMGDSEAINLFCKHAFKRDSPLEGFHSLTGQVVSNAGGLPLVLVTLGSLLSIEKDKVSWEEKLNKLQEIPPHEVLERLRISYDALDWVQKQIFLDIACFFVGVPKNIPVYMWDVCGFHPLEGIKALVRRSLITIREDDQILMMHDRLRELGKQIVKENLADPGERSRLWDHDEALVLLEKHPGLKKIEALCLKFDKPDHSRGAPNNPRLAGQDFAKLPKLRYLSVAFADLFGDFKGLHSQLRWLVWQGCLGNSTPTNIYLKNLVILDLSYSRITDNWKLWSQIKMAEKLKVLNLSRCYDLGSVPHLSNFTSLESLELNHCESLRRLDGLEQLVSLTYLSVSWCIDLERLPDLSKMGKLRTLDVSVCWKLTRVQGLEKLESLELLDISRSSLVRLPNLSTLRKLTSFSASDCRKLIEIQGLDGLQSLEHIDISGCKSLERLPDLSNLKKLRKLDTRGWKVTDLQGLGELESLEHLKIYDNECLVRLPDLSKLTWLRELEIMFCEKLIEIQGLHELESLERFVVFGCSSIKRVTHVSNLKRLKVLSIIDCEELTEVRGLKGLESLEVLDISGCKSIENLPDLSNLNNLKDINVCWCEKLKEIRGLEGLKSLTELRIKRCKSLKYVPELPNIVIVRDWDQGLIDFVTS